MKSITKKSSGRMTASFFALKALTCAAYLDVIGHRKMYRFVESYVHQSRIGVLIEFETDDDFTTNTDVFRQLARDLAMQIAAMDPTCIDKGDISNVVSLSDGTSMSDNSEKALLMQAFVKDTNNTVAEVIEDVASQLQAIIRIRRFE